MSRGAFVWTLVLALVPVAGALFAAVGVRSPAGAAYCSALAMALSSLWLWALALGIGLASRTPFMLAGLALLVLVISLLLAPVFDPEGLTGRNALIVARLDVLMILGSLAALLRRAVERWSNAPIGLERS